MLKDKIKLIIFDLDGTLLDAYPAITKSFNHTMQKLGYPGKPALVIRRKVGWGDRNLLKPFLKPKDIKKALLIYRRHHRKTLLGGAHLFPGVRKVLQGLKGKYKLAVASNRPTRFSHILIRGLGLARYFDYVLCADKLKLGKPHPDILNKIMLKFRFKRNQAVYVGDMAIDAEAGRRAGIKTIIVTTGSSTLLEVRKEAPWRIFKKITEIKPLF